MDLSAYRRTETLTIDAPAEKVYELVADVSAMGRWSPVCTGGQYDADDPTWFTGDNAIGEFTWSTRCRVDVADPGREFTFVNCGQEGKHEIVRWGFTLRAAGEGQTEVTQTWEVLPAYVEAFLQESEVTGDVAQRLDGMKGMAEAGMPETLAKLKAEAERAD
jgi:uncharacterized protein YndB with AHSA1/START domain